MTVTTQLCITRTTRWWKSFSKSIISISILVFWYQYSYWWWSIDNSCFQWVPLYLIFLSVLFYMPRCFWLMMEGGLMKFFGKGTTTRSPSPSSSSPFIAHIIIVILEGRVLKFSGNWRWGAITSKSRKSRQLPHIGLVFLDHDYHHHKIHTSHVVINIIIIIIIINRFGLLSLNHAHHRQINCAGHL